MKKALTSLLALGMVCFFAFCAVAEEKKVIEKPAERPQIAGTVVSVNIAAKTLVIKAKTGDTTIAVNEKTVVNISNQKKKLADIKAGEMAIIRYKIVDDVKIAKIIIIQVE